MAREQRKLAAIVAADVVGYSRLMGRDESGTLAHLRKNRSEQLDPVLAKYGGRLVKLTGDGALIEFASAVDALSAAIEFQQAMAEANRDEAAESALVYRIGLHLGDLIVDGDDLYGDGVNVAARLEAAAPAGGIAVSRTIQEAVAGRLRAIFDDLGSLDLKNIERPVQAFSVKWEASDWQQAVTAEVAAAHAPQVSLPLPDKPSIAVLPFQNMSGDAEQEYFVDGLVEDIITGLSRFKFLFVIARNSSFAYKGKSPDIRHVGRELGVRYVMEGSVRKAGDRLRITGQLIDASDGAHLWADRFEGALDNVFELQDQVTAGVIAAVVPKVDQVEIQRAKRKPVESLDAYDLYLRGMAKVYEFKKETYEEAHRLFYRAMEVDPDFVSPYAMAVRVYGARKVQGWVTDPQWEEEEVRRLALRISRIGRDDAVALAWAGHALVWICRDDAIGEQLLDEALSLNPNLATAWQQRGSISLFFGQPDVAVEQTKRALRLNPREPASFLSETNIASAYLMLGKYDAAVEWAMLALAHNPNWLAVLRTCAAAHAHAGNIEEARKMVARILQLVPAARLADFRAINPYRRPQDAERIIEGLRLAGLPE